MEKEIYLITWLWKLTSPKSAEWMSQFKSKAQKLLWNQGKSMSQIKNHQEKEFSPIHS